MTTKPRPAVRIKGPLGDMLRRRLGSTPVAAPPPAQAAPPKATANRKVRKGAVVPVKPDSEPLASLLERARTEIRAPRRGSHIHVSDLISKCVRKKVLVEMHSIPTPVQRLNLMDAITYRQGDAIHDVLKERAVQGDGSRVWGKWRCRCGFRQVEEPCLFSEVDQTILCERCEQPAKTYVEASFLDAELDILGHPDLILYTPETQSFYVTELKSISHEQFKELVRPKPDHVVQVVFYWFLMHRKGMTLADHVSILYATKGYTFRGKPYIEFVINVKAALKTLDPYLEDARAIRAARNGGELPPRVYCAARESPDARSCEAAAVCFGGAAPVVAPISFREAAKAGRG